MQGAARGALPSPDSTGTPAGMGLEIEQTPPGAAPLKTTSSAVASIEQRCRTLT